MTPEEKIKAIVEVVPGMCWHYYGALSLTCAAGLMCEKCGVVEGVNPSPTDMNALFRLAKKLKLVIEIDFLLGGYAMISVHRGGISKTPVGQSLDGLPLADALREALYQAVKGEG